MARQKVIFSRFSKWLHPTARHVWRWRALTFWIVVFTALVAINLGLLKRSNNHVHALIVAHNQLLMENHRLVTSAIATNKRQQSVIRLLCDRGYIMDGLVEAAINQTEAQQEAQPNPAAAEFLMQLNFYHLQLLTQLTDLRSPCVATK